MIAVVWFVCLSCVLVVCWSGYLCDVLRLFVRCVFFSLLVAFCRLLLLVVRSVVCLSCELCLDWIQLNEGVELCKLSLKGINVVLGLSHKFLVPFFTFNQLHRPVAYLSTREKQPH